MASAKEGIYFIRLKKAEPRLGFSVGDVLYIGKGDDVDERLAMELGKITAPATFFRSIGLLLGARVLAKSGKKRTGYNFRFENPEIIIEWLAEHVSSEVVYCDYRKREKQEIISHKPPLNIVHNSRYCHPELKKLRKQAHEVAAK